jgi:hypothetical protein
MTGEQITLYVKVEGPKDDFKDLTYTDEATIVANVLVEPMTGADLTDDNRPDGVIVKYRLHFPKAWVFSTNRISLRGTDIGVRGERCSVIGDPDAYTEANTPTDWCMPVLVSEVKG